MEPSTDVQAYAPESGPVFHRLFHTDRNTPVSSLVSELWNAKSVQFPVAMRPTFAGSETAARPAPARPLDLFHFLRPEIRSQANRSA
jgi:hypothetical protein